MSGLLVGLRGILGDVFSRGLDTVGARAEKELDWSYRGASWLAGSGEGKNARTWAGPVAVICHSAGEEGSYKFAEAFGRKIDLAFFVDSWFPDQKPHPHYRRVYSFKAGTGGRWHVQGANVVGQITYPDETHTTIDDEPKLHDFVIAKLAELTGETHTTEPDMKPFYMGEYKPLSETEIYRFSLDAGIPEYLVRAVIEIEAAGKGSHSSGALVARYEPHIAWDYTSDGVRQALVKEGLAYSNWREGYPKGSPYPLIDKCVSIAGEEVAALSTSWGLGQIMGFNHAVCGYESAVDMVNAFKQSEANQLQGMFAFIEGKKIRDVLLREDWVTFAETYNGSGQAKHNYSGRLAAAANKWRERLPERAPDTPVPDTAEPPVTLPVPPVGDMADLKAVAEKYADVILSALPDLTRRDAQLYILYNLYKSTGAVQPPTINGDFIPQPSPAIEPGFSLPEPQTKGTSLMGNYSKLIGSLVGGVVGILVAKNILPPEFNTPEMTTALTMVVSAFAVFMFPANQA